MENKINIVSIKIEPEEPSEATVLENNVVQAVSIKTEPEESSACYNTLQDSHIPEAGSMDGNHLVKSSDVKVEVEVEVLKLEPPDDCGVLPCVDAAKIEIEIQGIEPLSNSTVGSTPQVSEISTNTSFLYCDICMKKFSSKPSLIAHLKKHMDVTKTPYDCDTCNERFSNIALLTRHCKTDHYGLNPFACSICRKRFLTRKRMARHQKFHSAIKPFACEICDKRFTLKTLLDRHQRTHSTKSYTCKLCKQSFPIKLELTIHKRVHLGKEPFACQFCEKRFYTKLYLSTHIRRVHMNKTEVKHKVYLFQCEVCDKGFSIKSTFKRHMVTHVKERPLLSCVDCGQFYLRKNSLDRHRKKAHSKDPTLEFACGVCKVKFALNQQLTKHLCSGPPENPFNPVIK